MASPRLRLIGLFGLCCILGQFRWQGWMQEKVPLPIGQKVIVTGSVIDEPVLRGSQQEVELTRMTIGRQKFTSKILLDLPAYPRLRLGERVEILCKLVSFPADQRTRRREHGLLGECHAPEILSQHPDLWSWRLALGQVKSWTINRINQQFVEPQSSLLIGILLGRQVPMSKELDEAFRATGTTHLIALSGFNVTIMITAISAVLVRLVGKRWSWLIALGMVVGFVVLTGASASVTRAGVMACVALLVSRLGRPISMLRLLAYTLMIMVWHNPLVLVHDLGFQLSFLATVGLVYISPGIAELVRKAPEFFSIRENFATTIGAMLATEPLLLWHFARVSTVAPVVNVFVLPLIPPAMAAGFVAILLPFTWPVADATLRIILGAIQFAGQLSFASQDISGWHVMLLAGIVTFFAVLAFLSRHEKQTLAA